MSQPQHLENWADLFGQALEVSPQAGYTLDQLLAGVEASVIWDWLERMDITQVEVEFSGGNDSGGAETITLMWPGSSVLTSALTDDPPGLRQVVEAALEAPLYDRWGGFSGDFQVVGGFTWDVARKKIDWSYDESSTVWDSQRDETTW